MTKGGGLQSLTATPASCPLLEITGLCHAFLHQGQTEPVLNNISLTIAPGEIVCLIGRSGSGKSTLLNLVAGFLQPAKGSILLGGAPILKPGPDRCVVFQADALFPWLTVRENIGFGLRGQAWPHARRVSEISRFLELVGLQNYGDYLPRALSGGMKQRVALARVLIRSPRLLLMDEPFAALDAQTRGEMQALLLHLAHERQQTLLFITHDVQEAVTIADRVLVLDRQSGAISKEESIALDRPRDQTSAQFQAHCATLHQWLKA